MIFSLNFQSDYPISMSVDGNDYRTKTNISINEPFQQFTHSPSTSCTVFTVEDTDSVFFGNSEDEGGSRENTSIWFQPPLNESFYGCAFVGFTNNPPGPTNIDGLPIGGLNTQGLCFDANGLNQEYVFPETEKTLAQFSSMGYWEFILRECATVSEVIQWYQSRNMGGYWYNQVHWADSSGDAVVISPVNGEVAYTRKTGNYLVSTNFNTANPTYDYPCIRYTKVTNMLNGIIQNNGLKIDSLKDILDEVHLPKTSSYIGTVYSNIFDLKKKEIFLYVRANFEEVIKFNLDEELAKEAHEYDMIDLSINSHSTDFGFTGFFGLICIFAVCQLLVKNKYNH